MGIYSLFSRLRRIIRDSVEPFPESEKTETGIRPNVEGLKDDSDIIAFIRKHSEHKDIVIKAIARIRNQLRLQLIALDPDQVPYIRVAALGHIDSTGDDLRILIARSDRDPAVCIVAIQTLHDRRRAQEARDTIHDVVRLFLAGESHAES
ncbi:hypothetical protein IPH19_00255 [Candidatus Uhrbacteria bacterium]|nr:MAG: hypothetical protein IPH19_00255 [Candidatus Uhrbacteria bacterium]